MQNRLQNWKLSAYVEVPKATTLQLNSIGYKQKEKNPNNAEITWILQLVELAERLETFSIPFVKLTERKAQAQQYMKTCMTGNIHQLLTGTAMSGYNTARQKTKIKQ